jgi:Inner membrane protein YgaP-like, transmembrane domain
MKMEQYIRAIAGTFILISVGLGWFYHRYWFFFTVFVGLNLLQSAFTKWCLMEIILTKLGVVKDECCDGETSDEKKRRNTK